MPQSGGFLQVGEFLSRPAELIAYIGAIVVRQGIIGIEEQGFIVVRQGLRKFEQGVTDPSVRIFVFGSEMADYSGDGLIILLLLDRRFLFVNTHFPL